MSAHVLVVDDEALIRTSLGRAFEREGARVELADSAAAALAAFARAHHDLVILDLRLGDGDGLDVLRRLREAAPESKVIVITAHGSVENAVAAMKLGAFDFVMKPFELEELLTSARNALAARGLERRLAYHEARERRAEELFVPSRAPRMIALEREVAVVAAQPVPVVLVTGETGTGKSLVARRLHQGSERARGPFVELNVAAIPDTLVESELFGHERGAFSDARERKLGLVELADGGTLFLDEIGDLGPGTQAKLLTFLDTFSFRRVGGTAARSVDVRVVAATNRPLAELASGERFRADLYYRLAGIVLSLPPLRERAEDIAPLAAQFLAAYAARYRKRFRRLTDEVAALLTAWRWPGNVRELMSVVHRAVLMHDADALGPEHLPADLVAGAIDPIPHPLAAGARLPTLEEIELRYMRAVLALTGGNKVRAAEHLGISRQTLAKRLGDGD